jgi:hypothetical protein
MEIVIQGNPALSSQFTEIEVKGIHKERLLCRGSLILSQLPGKIRDSSDDK